MLIRDLLSHTSGFTYDFMFQHAVDELYRNNGIVGARTAEITLADFVTKLAGLPLLFSPGTRWNYSTGETHVAGALVRAATGKPVADYLSEKIWSQAGMQADANWWLESPDGLEVGGSGLSATLRDYARFGLFMLHDGVVNGQRVLPEGWMAAASSPQVVGGKKTEYGYMLWPLHGNSYAAIGIFGQFVFVDPQRNLVVAMWSAQPKPTDRHGVDEYVFLEALSRYFN